MSTIHSSFHVRYVTDKASYEIIQT